MRYFVPLLMILLFIICGCSNGSDNPVTPVTGDAVSISQPSTENSGWQTINYGRMNLEDGTIEPLIRSVDPYLNVTGYVGSHFSYTIEGIIAPNVLENRTSPAQSNEYSSL